MTNTKSVVILRGLPGSGKSWVAAQLRAEWGADRSVVCSADNFFMQPVPGGPDVYRYEPSRIAEAHAACLERFILAVGDGIPCVIVDNTNSRRWEFLNYTLIAHMFGYGVTIREIPCPDQETVRLFHSRNTHNVPLGVCLAMWQRWEQS